MSPTPRLKSLTDEYGKLRARLEQGGGAERIKRQHDQGKLTARERIRALLDQDGLWVEIGLLVAYDQYDAQAPAAGVVTGLGRVGGRPGLSPEKVRLAQTLYNDKTNSIAEICRTLRISRATLYRYVKPREQEHDV